MSSLRKTAFNRCRRDAGAGGARPGAGGPLPPQFIQPEDGHVKQDYELAAVRSYFGSNFSARCRRKVFAAQPTSAAGCRRLIPCFLSN